MPLPTMVSFWNKTVFSGYHSRCRKMHVYLRNRLTILCSNTLGSLMDQDQLKDKSFRGYYENLGQFHLVENFAVSASFLPVENAIRLEQVHQG